MDGRSDYDEWQVAAMPLLESLIAAAQLARDSLERGPAAILSAGDQLGAGSIEVASWQTTHVCPVPDVDGLVGKTARSFAAAGEAFVVEAGNPTGPDCHSLDVELSGLVGLIARTWAVMSDQADVGL